MVERQLTGRQLNGESSPDTPAAPNSARTQFDVHGVPSPVGSPRQVGPATRETLQQRGEESDRD